MRLGVGRGLQPQASLRWRGAWLGNDDVPPELTWKGGGSQERMWEGELSLGKMCERKTGDGATA